MWQRVKLSVQIRPEDTLACCWDVKQPTNKPTPKRSHLKREQQGQESPLVSDQHALTDGRQGLLHRVLNGHRRNVLPSRRDDQLCAKQCRKQINTNDDDDNNKSNVYSAIRHERYPHSAVHCHTAHTNAIHSHMNIHETIIFIHIYMQTHKHIHRYMYKYISTDILTRWWQQ